MRGGEGRREGGRDKVFGGGERVGEGRHVSDTYTTGRKIK